MKSIAAALAFIILTSVAVAQTDKRDLVGVAIGVSEAEALSKAPCQLKPAPNSEFKCGVNGSQNLSVLIGPISKKVLAVSSTFYDQKQHLDLFQKVCAAYGVKCPEKMTGMKYQFSGMGGSSMQTSTDASQDKFDLANGLHLTTSSVEGRFELSLSSPALIKDEKEAISKRNVPPSPRF